MDLQSTQFTLTITAENITSTDERFTLDNLSLGDQYEPIRTWFETSAGDVIERSRDKNERKMTNQTLPRLACQIFEQQLMALSKNEKERFPICQYRPTTDMIRGIFSTLDDFKQYRKSIEFVQYKTSNGERLIFYCWNVFSTILFVRECLKRFGQAGDKFVLTYQEKTKDAQVDSDNEEKGANISYLNPYTESLLSSKNIIFHGAPGTGKSYLAKRIAADLISDGTIDDYTQLSDEQKQQIEFVQFHPSYDYSDFVEGLRPKINDDGSMGFELQDGVFKRFSDRARKNFNDSKKSQKVIEKEVSVQNTMATYFAGIEFGVDELETIRGTKFYINDVDDQHINISIPDNLVANRLRLSIADLTAMLTADQSFQQVLDVTHFFGKVHGSQSYSYELALYNAIKAVSSSNQTAIAQPEKAKNYVFIIDEVNRGEISKIFGELFFAIDPGYRGQAGEVATQYANLHDDPNDKFYIPDNVYVIGTMNDIDRSVDSFDFAMRRRFRFIEIKADDQLEMLHSLGETLEKEATDRMFALNKEITMVEGLNESYQIGAAYFLKLKTLSFDQLWTDSIQPLLQDYVRGMYGEDAIMHRFKQAYDGNSLGDEYEPN